MTRAELVERIRKAVDVEPLDRRAARAIAERLERASEELLEPLLEAAQELGVRGHGRTVTVSLNVFIPLTNLCRDRCAYCTFAKHPRSSEAKTYQLDEVRVMARDLKSVHDGNAAVAVRVADQHVHGECVCASGLR